MALANNPTLFVASANVAAASGRQLQAGLRPNPTIGYVSTDIGEDHTAGEQGGFVSQQFITAGKLRLSRAVAGAEVQELRSQFDAQQLRVLSDVRMGFYDVLAAQKRMELTNQLVKTTKQSSDVTQRLLTAQQISRSDLLQSQVETEEARVLADNAQNQSAEAWRRLRAVVGLPELEEKALSGQLDSDLPVFDWNEAYSNVLGHSPELSAAQSRVERARWAIQRSRRENVPNVDVMVTASHRNQNGDDVAGVQVGIPIPICNRNQGNIMAADAELIAAENDVRRIQLSLQQRLATTYRRYANARQQVDRYRNEILPRAQQSLDLVSRGYGAGQLDFLVFLTSERTYVRVNLTYLDALTELRQAATLIEGQLLSDSLQAERSGNSSLK